MAQLITVRLNKSDQQPLGFRLQGGKDFGTPLVVQKVNGGSAAERAGLQAGDALIRVNNTDVYTLRHQEAQDTIRAAGPALELTVQRGGGTWRPAVTPTGSLPRPGTRPLGASPVPVTTTSLKATPQPSRNFGSGHNSVAKPFGYMNGNDSVKSIVNKQYNTPVNMYSDKTIAETLSAQTEVLAGGVLGVNFKKNEKTYDAEKSAVFKVLQEEQNDPEPVAEVSPGATTPVSGLRHVSAPVTRPDAPVNNTGGLPPGQNICEECERLITGVFVRIKDKNMHVECFKCSTCGSSLKNQGYYNLNGKLYCDIHAKLVARQNPPAAHLEPVTVSPGGRIPTNAYSTPLPPISTNNYTNGSSSMFSPSSTLSGPKPFGSSIGSAYSPASLSPRSAPLSPARPSHAPAPAPAPAPAATPFAPTKNVKSIVWPPPNHPDEESEKEINSNYNTHEVYSDPSALARESLVMMTDSNLNYINKMNSTEENISSSKQMTELSSDNKFGSALMASTQATSKSEFIMQSQKSQMIQEMSSCTVQSFSDQATSESQSFSTYQTHKATDKFDANAQITKKSLERLIDSQENRSLSSMKNDFNVTNIAEKIPQDMTMLKQNDVNKSINIKSSDVKQETTTIEAENKAIGVSSKPFNVLSTQYSPSINKASRSENKDNPSSLIPKPHASPNMKVKSSKEKSSKADGNLTAQKGPVTERRSLIDALTIAPDRPYSPLSFNIPNPNYFSTSFHQAQSSNSELIHPMPTQTKTCSSFSQSDQSQFDHENKQNANMLQISSEKSAFKPVSKQTLPPQQPEKISEVCKPAYKSKDTNSSVMQHQQQDFSSITCQSYAEQSNEQNTLSSSQVTIKSGLPKPENIPPYQQNQENIRVHGVLSEQNKTLPTNSGIGQGEILMQHGHEIPQTRTPVQQCFDEAQNISRNSPIHSRPTTPSLINKPAPIIPHYQMNLVTVEHVAPEGRMFKPYSDEVSRSSTPKVSRSPATVPATASNSLKAHAPRIKDSTQNYNIKQSQSSLQQVSSSKRGEYEMSLQDSNVKKWLQEQPPLVKEDQQSNLEHHSETYNRGDAQIKEDSIRNQHFSQRQMESQNVFEQGGIIMEASKKTCEEFERAQSAKTIEIQQCASQPSNTCPQIKSNIQPSNYNVKQVFPPPISQETMSFQQNLSFNTTNANVATTSNQTEVYQPTPFISGANQGPVCDPTPSTGSSVGAAARGKAFGVSSAPKRGRGVLNKAALPGSRVPLCASCNGNIR
ncbi:unnamed protein product [Euphydryas editha]|nr:unnamed protein product [Euphydryas editha]